MDLKLRVSVVLTGVFIALELVLIVLRQEAPVTTMVLLGVIAEGILFFGISYVLVRLLLRPFSELVSKTAGLDTERLSFRFPLQRGASEFNAVLASVNQLLDRQEQSFLRVSHFASFASHELRTPLTIVRGELEWLQKANRTSEELQTGLKTVLANTIKLQTLISRLLMLTDVERHNTYQKVNIGIDSLVRELAENIRLASKNERRLNILGEETVVCVYPEMLSSIVSNLIENALKFSNTRVNVFYEVFQDQLEIIVEDDGPGVAPESLPRLGEPFFRTNPQIKNGHGLGLAIVKACVQASQGSIAFETASLGGLRARVQIPA